MINTALESYGLKTSTGFDHGRVRLPCVYTLETQELPTNGVYRLPHTCTTVAASPELLVGETRTNSPAHQL